jgi:hypothetical protein
MENGPGTGSWDWCRFLTQEAGSRKPCPSAFSQACPRSRCANASDTLDENQCRFRHANSNSRRCRPSQLHSTMSDSLRKAPINRNGETPSRSSRAKRARVSAKSAPPINSGISTPRLRIASPPKGGVTSFQLRRTKRFPWLLHPIHVPPELSRGKSAVASGKSKRFGGMARARVSFSSRFIPATYPSSVGTKVNVHIINLPPEIPRPDWKMPASL